MRIWNRKTKVAVLLIVTTGVVAYAVAGAAAGWRAEVIGLKLRGQLPELGYSDLLAAMLPWRLVQKHKRTMPVLEPLVQKGEVSFDGRQQDEGPCPVLWRTPIGVFRGRLKDGILLQYLMWEVLASRAYDRAPADVRKGDVVLDVGGHLGTFTRYALSKGAQLVVAFEPEPTNIACFKLNLKREIEERKVILIEAAAWSSSGELSFELDENRNSGAGRVVGDGSTTVPAVTIDEILTRLGLDRVDFVKMDIEGAEREALAGARDMIARLGPRMAISVYHLTDDPEVIPRVVLDAKPDYRILRAKGQNYFYQGGD